MHDLTSDPRVTASGSGFRVATSKGTFHVLNADILGWGVYAGRNLDMVFTATGPAIGAADPNELIAALLEQDQVPTAEHEPAAESTPDPAVAAVADEDGWEA